MTTDFNALLNEVRACRVCEDNLKHGARPVVQAQESARILIISQAPGMAVHKSGIPFDDRSGDTLRDWMGIGKEVFYDQRQIAIVPMGFCYPGKGKSGDLPPRSECAPLWHEKILSFLSNLQLTLLVGAYAQKSYLDPPKPTLTETVASFRDYLPQYLPLVHPSPRNIGWQQKNPWFKHELVPELQSLVQEILQGL